VKNGILLVDYTNLLRRQGWTGCCAYQGRTNQIASDPDDASAAMLGMLPIAIGIGKDLRSSSNGDCSYRWSPDIDFPDALVVPTVYAVLDDAVVRFSRKE